MSIAWRHRFSAPTGAEAIRPDAAGPRIGAVAREAVRSQAGRAGDRLGGHQARGLAGDVAQIQRRLGLGGDRAPTLVLARGDDPPRGSDLRAPELPAAPLPRPTLAVPSRDGAPPPPFPVGWDIP